VEINRPFINTGNNLKRKTITAAISANE
jgi:hypothetical protein